MALAPIDVLQQPAERVSELQRGVYLAAARAGERVVAVGERGLIALSDDDGGLWRQVVSPVSATLTGVQFVSAKVGWVVGHWGVVLGTRDGGETWTLLLDGRRAAQATLDAAKAATDGSAASQKALVDAQRLIADGPDKPLLDLHFVDEQVGFVVGAYNLILRTEDGGRHWESIAGRLDNPKGLHLYAIAAEGATLYIAGEQGLLLRSDDDGAHFQRLALPYAGSLFTLRPLGREGLVVAGLRGNALVSEDRGLRWRALTGAPPLSFIAAFGDTDEVQLVNQAGQRFAVRGDRLVRLETPPLPPVSGALPLSSHQWLMLTVQGMVRRPESGARP
ncbi:Uncharacterized protein related to plant photosystem II stability/assembly factor [Variovorax sp. HW608]|nr:Uncharacterized protein related to plant photosystem II stability/assembly factor [Variovorax sp. HW608]